MAYLVSSHGGRVCRDMARLMLAIREAIMSSVMLVNKRSENIKTRLYGILPMSKLMRYIIII